MTHRGVLVSAVLLFCATSRARAHRLDEYLEQTLIELAPKRVVLHVDLTPGVAVAPEVLRTIDTDRNGALSASEQSMYAEQVRRDLSLSMNDAPLQLRVVEMRYPTVDSMTGGVGTITLTLEAPASPAIRSGTLRFANRHASAKAVYLVNCLMPRSPETHVLSQLRSSDQASYRVELGSGTSSTRTSNREAATWVVLALTGAVVCWWERRTRASRSPG